MFLNLKSILKREFYLLGIARKIFASGQKTVMKNFPEINSKIMKQIKREKEMEKEEEDIYSSA